MTHYKQTTQNRKANMPKSKKKDTKVRDLKPKKDTKGGGGGGFKPTGGGTSVSGGGTSVSGGGTSVSGGGVSHN